MYKRRVHLVLKLAPHHGKSQILRRVHNKKAGVHTRVPRFGAPPGSLGGTMRFHRRGIYAHAAPHLLGSILRASTPLCALSTREAAEPREEVDIKNEPSVCEELPCRKAPRTTLTRGQYPSPVFP